MISRAHLVTLALGCALLAPAPASPQSGRQSGSERGKEVIHIIVDGDGSGKAAATIDRNSFDLYDGGEPQSIEGIALDQTPARIALVVDNTKSLKVGLDDLKSAAHALVNELYEGDRMMVVGFDETPYVLQEFTTDLKQLDATADEKFQKNGTPHLFDALEATVQDGLLSVGSEKRAIVILGDGYDRGSTMKFPELLAELQREDIVVYVLQAPDRTRGASRLDGPKPQQAVLQLCEATGGRAFPLSDAKEAAKIITEELRLNWYRVVYNPRGVDRLIQRNILLMRHDPDGPAFRTKASHPGRIAGRRGQA